MGERLLRKLQLEAPRRTPQRGNLLHSARGQGDHRELETALQHRPPALFARLPTTRTRGFHARAPGFAIWTSYARRALAGAKTNPKLTSQPDHSIGAGHTDTVRQAGIKPGDQLLMRPSEVRGG